MSYTTIDLGVLSRRPAVVWARETFGKCKPPGVRFCDMRWYQRDVKGKQGGAISRFYFKEESDAIMFALKWSGHDC